MSFNVLQRFHRITFVEKQKSVYFDFQIKPLSPQIFLAFLCAHLSTISMVEASNSNCPKVAFIGDFHVVGSGIRNSTCKGTMLRASTWSKISNSYIPGTPDINGRGKHRTSNKADIYFSKRTCKFQISRYFPYSHTQHAHLYENRGKKYKHKGIKKMTCSPVSFNVPFLY